ncbi:hypothetical protein [Streptomyces pseudovenezuelae]|uniref:DUF3592 domain-containing protein n=1 Tax=Streptomyces pseudovenezuelae TaxID=67350 RepID=A0ABT6LN58_9ACTN|nr:hypothetical protein [Streptomyces pseudovenezuelae]MDH6217747.1 hypothetical protein [Streptomyces pseudovenezuelae]
MAREDGPTADELFARLEPGKQRAFEEAGLGLPELRRISEQDGDTRRVRLILDHADARPPDDNSRVWPWIRLPLIAVVGVVVCLASTYLIDKYAVFVGVVLGLAVIRGAVRAPSARGGLVVRVLVVAAYVVLIWPGSQQADKWYLQVRGQETAVTYAKPVDRGSHGVTTLYCRVKLPDGSIHQVFENDKWCTDETMVGTRAQAVVDPAGHYRPFLGRKSDLDDGLIDYLCLGAAAVLVLAPLTAAAMSRASGMRGNRGNQDGRARDAGGAAV